ncbi:MAG: hypothetical protein KA791_12970 [Flavobacteriales bacterium]|nr:hypothetical protein [Flavobacteriales bacterium]
MQLPKLLGAAAVVLLLQVTAAACTFFKLTVDGHTMVGNNEDAWSIDPRIWFENGKQGEYGAVYLGQNNSTPQGGMNEAGLMFDGLRSPAKMFARAVGRPPIHFDDLARRVLRSCADVHEAATLIRTFDFSELNGAYLIFVDRSGEYLVVEADTLFTGNDANYAVTNICLSTCTDFDSVPSERYQRGRALLAAGADTSLAFCTSVVNGMHACRKKLGEGTLYSNILDPQRGLVHLYFYHDYTTLRTFDLKAELAKGDHSLDMIALFPPNAEFAKLVAYRTPFHSMTLRGFLLFTALVALLFGVFTGISLLLVAFARLRGKRNQRPVLPLFIGGACSLIVLFLVPALLINQSVFYFGLGDTTDRISPVLAYLPLLLCLLALPLVLFAVRGWRMRSSSGFVRISGTVHAATVVALVAVLFYWDLVLV